MFMICCILLNNIYDIKNNLIIFFFIMFFSYIKLPFFKTQPISKQWILFIHYYIYHVVSLVIDHRQQCFEYAHIGWWGKLNRKNICTIDRVVKILLYSLFGFLINTSMRYQFSKCTCILHAQSSFLLVRNIILFYIHRADRTSRHFNVILFKI